MTAEELINALSYLPPDTPVVFPDSENGYRNVGIVTATAMTVFSSPTLTYDKPRAGRVNEDGLPTRLVAVVEEER